MISHKKIPVVLIAGGFGTRLRPLTDTVPKPLIKVGGVSLLEHNIQMFKYYGFSKFIICVCYLKEQIISHFKDGTDFGVSISYCEEDVNNPLGTAGAVGLTQDLINSSFIVCYPDILRNLDISALVQSHKRNKAFATLQVYKRINRDAKSMVIFDKDFKISQFVERPQPSEIKDDYIYANGSFYMFESGIFSYVSNRKVDFGKDIFPQLLADHKLLNAFPSNGYFVDVGDTEKLQRAEADIKSKKFKPYAILSSK